MLDASGSMGRSIWDEIIGISWEGTPWHSLINAVSLFL